MILHMGKFRVMQESSARRKPGGSIPPKGDQPEFVKIRMIPSTIRTK
jgi:hypothetical protein